MKRKHLTVRFTVCLSGILLLLSLALWMGCGDTDTPTKPEATEETEVSGAPPRDVLAMVMAIQEFHTDRLMSIPGVVGTATELGTGGPVIAVYTEKPGVVGIPGILDSVPVAVRVSGKIRALKPPENPGKPPKPEPVDPKARFPRPVPIGVSTGHPDITAGTIGCRVSRITENGSTEVFALSNNHVYANKNEAAIGDSVLQPGAFDGGVDPDDSIGTLFDFEPIDFSGGENKIDAAIALSSTDLLGNATPSDGYGSPRTETVGPEEALGQRVMKYGRTTGKTSGMVVGINGIFSVDYGNNDQARFIDQLIITPGTFSAGGDSGSLIVLQKKPNDRKPVGLLFAGSEFMTIANPIDPVLECFGVTIDGE